MPKFRDREGNDWDVELTIGVARKAFDISKPDAIAAMIDDPYARFDLLWMMCQAQADARSIKVDQFDTLLADTDVYVSANTALLEAIEDFFQRLGKESLSTLISTTRTAATRLESMQTEKLKTIGPTIDKVVSKAITKLDEAIQKAGA